MKYLVPAIITALAMASCGGKPAGELAGFRGVPWLQHASKIENLTVVKTEKHDKTCVRKNENMSMGSLRAESIEYDFYRDRFWRARIGVKNLPGNYEALTAHLNRMHEGCARDRETLAGEKFFMVCGTNQYTGIGIKLEKPKTGESRISLEYMHLHSRQMRMTDSILP